MCKTVFVLLTLGVGLTGCAHPVTTPMTDRMDNYFDNLSRPDLTIGPPEDSNRPGYAPAYPPYE